MRDPEPLRQAAIAEAVALFDAGNHAWGRFYQYLYLRHPGHPPAPDAAPVREALREAAISVPQTDAAAELQTFASAVAGVYEAITTFLAIAPPSLRVGEVLTTPDSLRECLRLLMPYLDPP